MRFIAAVRSGFINYTNFKFRSSRSSYWYWTLFTVILGMLTSGSDALNLVVQLAVLVPSVAVAVRRMHDVDRSGWWILFPIYNFVLACRPSNLGENSYGPPEPPVTFI